MSSSAKIAILGSGNIGAALAKGLVASGNYQAGQITLTRRKLKLLEPFKQAGYKVSDDNKAAVAQADIVVLAVLPQQLNGLLNNITGALDKQLVISVISGVTVKDILDQTGKNLEVVRAMPNTAIAISESMTCMASDHASKESKELVKAMFDTVGITVEINEELMTSATALCACGIAFFLRAIRAASQGGIEIGFHANEALRMAAQTAKGAASLLLEHDSHPEHEIDKVTSPKGCTIAGLNEMEHQGFSSAMIKGIRLSANKAGDLYEKD